MGECDTAVTAHGPIQKGRQKGRIVPGYSEFREAGIMIDNSVIAIYIKLCAAHWYLMMVANCFPEIPVYIESNASANFSESSADAGDCCNIISSFVLSET